MQTDTITIITQVVKQLGNSFDVLSKAIMKNKTDIIDLQKRIRELEAKDEQNKTKSRVQK